MARTLAHASEMTSDTAIYLPPPAYRREKIQLGAADAKRARAAAAHSRARWPTPHVSMTSRRGYDWDIADFGATR